MMRHSRSRKGDRTKLLPWMHPVRGYLYSICLCGAGVGFAFLDIAGFLNEGETISDALGSGVIAGTAVTLASIIWKAIPPREKYLAVVDEKRRESKEHGETVGKESDSQQRYIREPVMPSLEPGQFVRGAVYCSALLFAVFVVEIGLFWHTASIRILDSMPLVIRCLFLLSILGAGTGIAYASWKGWAWEEYYRQFEVKWEIERRVRRGHSTG